MTTHDLDSERPPIDGGEVMFLLLKHRWKLILCILAGLGAAAYVYFNHQPPYESQAKLLVRYVLERSPIDTVNSQVGGNSGRNNDGIISSELAILQSWDLANEVARQIGPQRLLGYPTNNGVTEAASKVRDGLWVESSKGSNVISVGYRNPDPQLAVDVLDALLTRYFEKHLNVHRSVGTFEFVATQKQKVTERLKETEDRLHELKAKARVISLPEINTAINEALTRSQTSLEIAEVELAEQLARVNAIEKMLGRSSAGDANAPKPTQGEIQQYNAVVARLGVLRREGLDLLSRYTAESRLVKINRSQISQLETQRAELEQQFPSLALMGSTESPSFATQNELLAEQAKLAAINGRTEALRKQVADVRERAQELSQYGPVIAQLERQKQVEEENYKYFEATLERARIDEALDPSKIPNISVVQQPSPAQRVDEQINKQIAMLAGGGAVVGLGLVFLLGFVFDRSVKRPADLHRKLGLNHLLAIPYVKRATLRALSGANTPLLTAAGEPSTKDRETLTKAKMEEFVGPYCEAICDRLIHTFQIEGKTHKPKLVAVTSCHRGAGTSTIAAGLAAALSRTGDGKVLLVDMNTRRTDHRYYFGGKHVSSLVDVLQEGSTAQPAAENLYLATVSAPTAVNAARPLPVRFHSLLPRLKHSEFDYVIFDMPPADDTSATLAIAGFVDKVFLVVEAEKTSREAARRAHSELLAMRADTSILVNKTRQYGPRWLSLES